MSGLERAAPSSRRDAWRCDHDAVHRVEMGRARYCARQPHRQFQPKWRKAICDAVRAWRIAAANTSPPLQSAREKPFRARSGGVAYVGSSFDRVTCATVGSHTNVPESRFAARINGRKHEVSFRGSFAGRHGCRLQRGGCGGRLRPRLASRSLWRMPSKSPHCPCRTEAVRARCRGPAPH